MTHLYVDLGVLYVLRRRNYGLYTNLVISQREVEAVTINVNNSKARMEIIHKMAVVMIEITL